MAIPSTAMAASTVSLYVGDLPPDVTEAQLLEAFSDYKSLTSVRICRDLSNVRSTYAYVNFLSQQEAINAIEAKNHTMLNGRRLRVSWSCRDSDARKSGVGNVFVKNLMESVDDVGLHDMFRKFGNIISCKVAMSDDGRSKGHGFVQFETEESANAAIENLNGSTIDDKQIYVGMFLRKNNRILPSPDAKYTNLYLKNLDLDVTEEMINEKFSEFGNIISLVIAKDVNGTSRGFGFVNFDNPADARRATEVMNGSQLGSKILYVARAQKKAEREQILRRQFEEKRREQFLKFKGSNVYVKNIADEVTDEELRKHFSQCGTITSAKLMRDEKGMNKGFGFVCFSTPEEASKAVNILHGYMFHRKPLYVAIAQRKEDRQAQLQLQYARQIGGLAVPSHNFIPGGYPPLYNTATSGVVPPPRPGMIYPPLGMRGGGWRPNGSAAPPTRPAFQASPLPVIQNNPRQNRQNRGRMMNGHVLPQSYLQQPNQSVMMSSKDSSNQQRAGQNKYVPNVPTPGDMNKGSNSVEKWEITNGMLAAASPEQQKQMLGEQLYPLVEKHQPDLVAKITGMLLEMDNSELLLLLVSAESLAARVEEAVQVLKVSSSSSQAKVSSSSEQGAALHPSYLSAEVAVN